MIGLVGWCLGAYSEVGNTYVHHIHTFIHTLSGLYNPLQRTHTVSRPHILYTTLYNTSTVCYLRCEGVHEMVDMGIHDVSFVVGWCLGAYSEVENTYVYHIHTQKS